MAVVAPSRTARRPAGAAQVTLRDLAILLFVAKAQPVRAVHLATLVSAPIARVRERLRRLRDLGYLKPTVLSLNEHQWYTLTPSGRTYLVEKLGRVDLVEDGRTVSAPRSLSRRNLEHHGGAVTLHAALEVACARRGVGGPDFAYERTLRRLTGGTPGVVVPDAVALFRAPEPMAVVFEIDCATMNPSAVARKAEAYAAPMGEGRPMLGAGRWTLAFFVTDTKRPQRRANRLLKAFAEAGVGGEVFVGVDGSVTDRNILVDAWRRLVWMSDTQVSVAAGTPVLPPISNPDVRDLGQSHEKTAFEAADHNRERASFLTKDSS